MSKAAVLVYTEKELQEEHKKDESEYRNYDKDGELQARVENLYKQKYEKMTLAKVLELKKDYGSLSRAQMTIWEALEFLNTVVDESDPDVDKLPQLFHAFQTAEACRKQYPDEGWLHLTGLIHDLGKILASERFGSLDQYAVVGDIYPVGCAPQLEANVLSRFFEGCPDNSNPELRTACGVYQPNCGFENLHMAFTHDEYMYRVLSEAAAHQNDENAKCKMLLPPEALYMIRFHSFYPAHCAKRGDYRCLASEYDLKVGIPLLQKFSRCDLYSKVEVPKMPDEKTVAYYRSLIDKYLPGVFKF